MKKLELILYIGLEPHGCHREFKSKKTVKKLSEAPKNVLKRNDEDSDYKV